MNATDWKDMTDIERLAARRKQDKEDKQAKKLLVWIGLPLLFLFLCWALSGEPRHYHPDDPAQDMRPCPGGGASPDC